MDPSLPSLFSLNPTSLSAVSRLLHIPLERMTEERAEQSVHLLNLSGGKFYRLKERGRKGESWRVERRNYEIWPLFHRERPGREGEPPG